MAFNYQPPETLVIFNEGDADLSSIEYELKPPKDLTQCLNYGIDPLQQKWRRFEMPGKLYELQEDTSLTALEKVQKLESNHSYYKDEIAYIKRDWDYFKNGLWAYIKGTPYYISGDCYFWLQWWRIEGKSVDFRMRDRKYWMFEHFIENDPDCIGMNYPKHRREGATNRNMCKMYKRAISSSFSLCGIQSKDEKHAAEIFEQYLLPVWRDYLPFWYKPVWNGQSNDLSALRFTSPLAKNNPDYGRKALNSIIDYRNSGEKAYDGLKLRRLFNDEIGKTIECDVKRRWDIQRQCLSEGTTIVGKAVNASTVDEMDKGGGRNFKKLCDQSHYHKKDKVTGRTTSWLYNFFMPASEGFGGEIPRHLRHIYGADKWIDEYGFDVISPITNRPAAEDFHLAQRQAYKSTMDYEGEIEYTRQFPLKWKDCWKTSVKDCNFNLAVIEDRLDFYRNGNPDKQRGNFEWEGNIPDTKVVWVPDDEGKFYLSWQFPDPRDASKYHMVDGSRVPGNKKRFVAGGDPFKFKTTKTGKKSEGGGAVFMKHDILIDPPGKDVRDFQTNRFVCTYSNRPKDKTTYGEDMIMMCVYFGCEMFPELNVEFLWDYFVSRGYGMYLCYGVDRNTNKVSATPGANTGEKVRERIFREWQYYIQHFGVNERHDELLEQCKEIEDDMGDFDLFVAGGYALMANSLDNMSFTEDTDFDIEQLFPSFVINN
jgi:hypothetical protein